MNQWRIEPRDPLVVRDGRPNDGRSESAGLPFPLPSNVAGAVRTRLGTDQGKGFVLRSDAQISQLKQVQIRGPLLTDSVGKLYVHPPADAWVVARETLEVTPLAPLDVGHDVYFDGAFPEGLRPVGFPKNRQPEKPTGEPPLFWSWEALEHWLLAPADSAECRARLAATASVALGHEMRLHVALDATFTAWDTMLYHTPGLRFTYKPGVDGPAAGAGPQDLALWLDVEPPRGFNRALRPGLAPLGGERRLSRWAKVETDAVPPVPKALLDAIAEPCTVRVILLTPGYFEGGSHPVEGSYLFCGQAPVQGQGEGQEQAPAQAPAAEQERALGENGLPDPVAPRLIASRVDRPVVVSGWDLRAGGPKATRRLAPAGSVYWVRLEGTQEDRKAFVERVWFRNISDTGQDRADGFGLAVLGLVADQEGQP